ncbi:MAG: AtpZ/AtpI family protein [Fidelibacterota bacterium]
MPNRSDKEEFLSRVFVLFSRMLRDAGPYVTASYVLVGSVLGLALAGYFMDRWLGTEPWILLGGTVLGLVVGLYEMARIVLKK